MGFCLSSFPTVLLLRKQRACCTGEVILLWLKWTAVVAWTSLLWVWCVGEGCEEGTTLAQPLQCPHGWGCRGTEHWLCPHPGPHLQQGSAESLLQLTAGTKAKDKYLRNKYPLDHQKKLQACCVKWNCTFFKAQQQQSIPSGKTSDSAWSQTSDVDFRCTSAVDISPLRPDQILLSKSCNKTRQMLGKLDPGSRH